MTQKVNLLIHHHQPINCPLLGYRPFLWITHMANGPKPTTRTQCGLVSSNDCKYSQDKRLNVTQMGEQKSIQVLCASEGTLSHIPRLHLQLLAPTPFQRRVDVRQADDRKNKLPNLYDSMVKTCCTDSTVGIGQENYIDDDIFMHTFLVLLLSRVKKALTFYLTKKKR
jgi:hypothetical protein